MSSYSELLNDERWKRASSGIKGRDNGRCRCCGNSSFNLQVHHIVYKKNLMPWEYEPEDMITLCGSCHEFISTSMAKSIDIVRRISCNGDNAEQLLYLLERLKDVDCWTLRALAKRIDDVNDKKESYNG